MLGDRSITVTLRANIADYKAKLADAGRVTLDLADRTQKSLIKHRQSVTQLADTSMRLGGAAVLGVGLAIKSYSDFDAAMSKVAATGSDARASLSQLTDAALKTGPALGKGATAAAGGIEALLKAGVSASDVIGGGLTGALTLASAGVMDVSDAAETAATAMTQFKLSGRDVPHIADLLAAGAGKAQGEVSDLAFALKQSGLVASQFGLSVDETVGTLTAFASAGLLGSDAGTSFRTMLLRLSSPSQEAADTMERLGIAAYDAQGNFVGIANLSEQLKVRLQGLAPAQRDAALATIFGSDAIRAANVLYAQGADGINKWVSSVNEQGYAAEVARTKLDNLQGDMQKLAATGEAAFISLGKGSDGPLRSLAQNVTGLLEGFSKLPPSVQQGTLAVVGVGGAALVAGGAVVKLAVGAAETWRSFRDLIPAGSKLSGTLGTVGAKAAAATVALIAISQLGGKVQEAIDARHGTLSDMASALQSVTQGSHQLTKLDAELGKVQQRFFFWETGQQQVTGVADAIRQVRDNTSGVLGGLSALGQVLASIVGQKTALTSLQEQFAKMDEALSHMDAAGAQTAFSEIADAAAKQGIAINDVVSLFPQYRSSLVETANQLHVTTLTAEDYARWMAGEIPPAISAAVSAQGSLDSSLAGVTVKTDAAKVATQQLTDALKTTNDVILGLSNSQIAFEAAIDETTAKIADNGKGLDVNTGKGRANQQALNDLASASQGYITKLIETGASSDQVSAAQERARAKFVAAAVAAGMGAKEAKNLADKLLAIPKNVSPTVTPKIIPPDVAGMMASIQRRINANPLYVPVRSPSGAQFYRAHGGPLPGYAPHDRADNVMYAGTPGEWVIQRPSVRYYGDQIMAAINAGKIPKERLQHLAYGGRVGSSSGASPSAAPTLSPADLRAAFDGARIEISGVTAMGDVLMGRLSSAVRRG